MNEIFVFAQTRSGSTLLQRAINQTPGTLIYGEHGGLLDGFATAYYSAIGNGIHSSRFEPAKLRDPEMFAPCLSCITPGRFSMGLRDFISYTLNPARAERWGFKEVRYRAESRVFDLLSDLFLNAQFVFLIRDPREQIQSIRSVPWGDTGPFENSLRYWVDTFSYFLHCANKHPQRCMILDYNNLRRVRPLFNWLHLDSKMSNLFKEMPRTGSTEDKKGLTVKELLRIEESGALDAYIKHQWNL